SLENIEGALDKALEYEGKALDAVGRAGDRGLQALILANLALVHGRLGQNDKAIDDLQQALPMFTDLGDSGREAIALNNLGGIYDSLAEPEKALETYSKALKLGEEEHDQTLQARALNNLGVVYSNLGDDQQALEYYNKAITLMHDLGLKNPRLKNDEALALDNVGYINVSIGRIKEALEYYKRALDLHRGSASPLGEATTLEDIGYATALLKQPADAADYYKQALDLARKIGYRQREASVLTRLGDLYASTGQLEKAFQAFNDALPISREIGDRYKEANALEGIASVKRDQGDLDGSRQQIESAIGVIESLRSRVTSRQLQASFLANRGGEDAYEFYVSLLMQLDRLRPGQGYAALALNASEHARARSLLDTLAEAHADITSEMDPNLLNESQRLQAELNRKAQLEALPANSPKEKENRAAVRRQIDDLLSQYDQVQAEMRFRNPRYADLTAPRLLDLAGIQKTIADPDTVLFEYSLGREHSYLWSVSADSFHSFELPAGPALEAEARNLQSLLTARNVAVKFETPEEKAVRVAKADTDYWTAAAKLSQEILGPGAADLSHKRLVVVAGGALQYIPFGALPAPGWQSSTEPLVLSHEVLTLPSASVLAVLRSEVSKRKPAPKGIAVLADPVFEKDDPRVLGSEKKYSGREAVARRGLRNGRTEEGADHGLNTDPDRASADLGVGQGYIPRLPHTRDEAEAILALLPRRESLAALGFDASLKTATSPLLRQYRILHFATHGFIDGKHPQLSGIVLSLVNQQGEPIDGFLRLNEIYNLRLPADLVVLSGCETGLGEEMKGEGLIGLTRGFMYAGAPSVVVSLWDVSDRGTAEFMKLFYQNMLRRGLSPSRALQAAQLEAIKSKQLDSPYYWAAFEVQGDWK
ncbi:MAG TPA: CHAT domain-containing protein, partial [Blastocatellia bacterium]|nr:CHAT domain-containing protein [Blastocatellia bacterium]